MPSEDVYTHGHNDVVVAQHARRTAATCAAHLVPHIREGDRLLDVGCGPGTITTGLAALVGDGEVAAIDVTDEIIATAANLARVGDVENISFAVGNVYDIDAPNNSFDVAHAHQVLQHLTRPVDALAEMGRVVRPGGLVAVRDADYGTFVHSPHDELLDAWLAMYHRVAVANKAQPDAGRYLLQWCHAAGFDQVELTSDTWTFADSASRLNWGDSWAERTLTSALGEQAVSYGVASQSELEEMAEAWRRWARDPDAVYYLVHVAALAVVPG